MTPVLHVEGAGFRYRRGTEPAISGVDLELAPGEVLLVAGPSGCGKSTLIRMINGMAPHSYPGELFGSVTVGGLDTRRVGLRDLASVVGTLLQDPSRQIVGSTVRSELAFGPENLGLDPAEIRRRIDRVIEEAGLAHLVDRPTSELSGGERQLVAFAGVLVLEPSLYVIDEPLANLDPRVAQRLLALLRSEADAGRSVVLVEHRVEEALEALPDRVLALDEGRPTFIGAVADFLAVADPSNVKIPFDSERLARLPEVAAPPSRDPGRMVAEVRSLQLSYGPRRVLDDASVGFRAAETVAVLGANGAGKTTLFRCLMGLAQPDGGSVLIGGGDAAGLSVAERARQIGFVFQSPRQMLFAPTVFEELAFGPRLQGLDDAHVATRVDDALARVGLAHLDGILERPPLALSFGQQKRLAVAIAIALGTTSLILDEPTAGQDLGTAEAFVAAVLAIPGLEHLTLVTHDVDLAVTHADRLVLVSEGTIVADGAPTRVLADQETWVTCGLVETSLIAAARRVELGPGRVPPPPTLARLARYGSRRSEEEIAHD